MRISQRTTLFQLFMSRGRSRYDWIQSFTASAMMASLVGRMASGSSSSFAARAGDPGDLRVEALDVIGLPVEQGLGHEQREVDVVVPGGLDVAVELVAHRLPDGEAVGPDDHAAAHRRVAGQLCLQDDVVVPAGEVLRLTGQLTDETGLGHRASWWDRWVRALGIVA